MGECVVRFARGPECRLPEGENLLRGALRQGLGFPYECGSGGCGSCQFELVSGQVRNIWENAPGLSTEARQAGRHLACQARVLSDCEIKVRLKPQYAPTFRPQLREVRYLGRRVLTADMAEYSFQSDAPADFLAGQYALLSLPGIEGDRAYSMSNLPNPDGIWSFIIKRVPDGKGSRCIESSLAPGDTLKLDGPFGLAHLQPDRDRDIVCIGGGSGLSPIKSILSAAVRDPRLAARTLWIFYGGRTPADICIDPLLNEDPLLRTRVRSVTAISSPSPDSGWSGKTGFIHSVLDEALSEADGPTAADCEFYFCGPPPMTDAVQRLLMLERKVPAQQLHFDRFL